MRPLRYSFFFFFVIIKTRFCNDFLIESTVDEKQIGVKLVAQKNKPSFSQTEEILDFCERI